MGVWDCVASGMGVCGGCVCGGGGVGLIVDLWQWQEGVEGVRWWGGVGWRGWLI